MYKIEIENNVTHQKYTYDNVEDKNNGKKLFYKFYIDTSNLDDGEYTLSLYDGNNLITSELLKIGDFSNKSIQYSKGSNVYIDAKPNKIDVNEYGINFGYSSFSEIPDIFDFSNVKNMYSMFKGCNNLTTIPLLDTSNITVMTDMFYGCTKLQSLPLLDTSNVTIMLNMFNGCSNLTTIPQLNTLNVKNMGSMFADCSKLTTIPLLDTTNVTYMEYVVYRCNKLTNLGGFKNLKISVTNNFLNEAPNLTTDSLMNVINYLYDLTANGINGKTLKFGQTNLDKLTAEQIAVATAKGWTLIA